MSRNSRDRCVARLREKADKAFWDIGHLETISETIGETIKFQSVLEESCLAFDLVL